MENKTNYQPRIVRGKTEMWVPHSDGEIAFAFPSVGPSNYRNIGKQILNLNQKVPTGDYTASLLHSAYCSDSKNEKEFENVRDVMKNRWLWVYNINLWTPNGVYVLQDLEAKGRSEDLDVKNLEKMLKGGKEISGIRFSEDGLVRFAPKGSYSGEYMAPEQLAKDGFIIASVGLEGAEKLGEVSTKFKNQPYVYSLNIEKCKEQRVSAVDGNVGGLRFLGIGWDGSDGCHAFGVWK